MGWFECFTVKKGCLCKNGVSKIKSLPQAGGSDMVHTMQGVRNVFAPNHVEIF